MYMFFTQQGKVLPAQELTAFSGAGIFETPSVFKAFFNEICGEERPSNMLILLSILVFLVHVWGVMWRQSADETQLTPAKPLLMEVAMLRMSAPKPSVAPPPPPAPPQAVKKPEPIKPLVKTLPKKLPPVVKKVLDTAPAENAVAPEPIAQANSTPAPPSPAVSSSSQSHIPVNSESEQYTPANFHANYASNPKPEYPSVARSREWQGKVMLRVQVSVEGLSDAVKVEKSSGHEMLDDCAVEAVKKWKFIPAKRGETAVASSVLVPISFSLND